MSARRIGDAKISCQLFTISEQLRGAKESVKRIERSLKTLVQD